MAKTTALRYISGLFECSCCVCLQTIKEADTLEVECDQNTFFSKYSSVNAMLEERFVDLLLLISKCEVGVELELPVGFDLSGVLKVIEGIPSKKSCGKGIVSF